MTNLRRSSPNPPRFRLMNNLQKQTRRNRASNRIAHSRIRDQLRSVRAVASQPRGNHRTLTTATSPSDVGDSRVTKRVGSRIDRRRNALLSGVQQGLPSEVGPDNKDKLLSKGSLASKGKPTSKAAPPIKDRRNLRNDPQVSLRRRDQANLHGRHRDNPPSRVGAALSATASARSRSSGGCFTG